MYGWILAKVGIVSCDIMYAIQENRPKWYKDKKFPSLEDLIRQHYGAQKTPYNPDDMGQLLHHCREDVEFTKKIYEEKIWRVPVLERRGSPIGTERNPLMLCPLCGGKIIIHDVNDEGVACSRCGRHEAIAPLSHVKGSDTYIKEWGPTCRNCRKELVTIVRSYVGYGAKHGTIKRGRSLCPICREGCFEWRDDNAPGFKEHWKGSCCSCGKSVDTWNRRSKFNINKTN